MQPARTSKWPAVALAGAAAVASVWIGAAVLTAGHGFDLTDEGYYLLSYRWWDVNPRTFTGSQYLYGPVFELLGHDIAGLRLFRLLTIVLTHLGFGWAFMGWLRLRRPAAPATRLWEAAGTATILAAGGAIYGWLPQSPGYNDVVLLGAMSCLAVVLRIATYAERDARVPIWLPVVGGLLLVPILLAKWSAGPLLLLIAVTGAVTVYPLGWRALGRAAAGALAGVVTAIATVHLLIVPLTYAVPYLVEVNRLLSAGSFSLPVLLERYWDLTRPMLLSVARYDGLLLVAAAAVVLARRKVSRIAAVALAVLGAALSAYHVVDSGALGGGRLYLYQWVLIFIAALAFTVSTAVAAIFDRQSSLGREHQRGWLLLGVVFLLPILQTLGTSNAPFVVATNGFAVWMALLVAVVTGLDKAPAPARVLAAGVATAVVVATACVATGGLWRHPYRTPGRAETTSSVPGVTALNHIRLDAERAAGFRDLHRQLEPYLWPGRPMMAFDTMPGVVLVLGGRPLGEAWYAPADPARTSAGILADCRVHGPWHAPTARPGRQAPILLFDRPVTSDKKDLFRACGLDFDTGYRLLAPKEQTMRLEVYVPADDPASYRWDKPTKGP
ncbi:hypothetical protein [Actinoplanes sp. NPDC051859]|uniref:hypothetical protein n=1 Tax=Actinoplanes sp. NPDC051859 TaxID=3363909 RepID=UPI0037971A99